MKKFVPVILIIFLFAVFHCSNETGEPGRQEEGSIGVQFVDLTIPEALVKAEAENKIVLIDFFSPT